VINGRTDAVVDARARGDDAVESFEVRAIAVERLTFFVDAVIAIAITLLALDLPVPTDGTNRDLLHFTNVHREEYIAFLISFAVIGAYWRAHHRVFRYVTALDGPLVRLTLYWLLMQVITPFATRVLTGDGAFQARFIFYATVQAVASLVFILMVMVLRRYKITREDTPPRTLRLAVWHSAFTAGGFLVSIPFSFVGEAWAYGCWIAAPVLAGVLARVLHLRDQPGRSQSAPSSP
jgi:uncharacterized membrane protein